VTVKPRRPRPTVRRYYTETAGRILADCYGGQVRAVVIERALREMAIRDGLLTPKTHKPTRRGSGGTG
jgi:hypothetical protein